MPDTPKYQVVTFTKPDGTVVTKLRRDRVEFDSEAKERFLAQISDCGIIGAGLQAAGVSGRTFYQHLDADEDFALAYKDALEDYRARLLRHHQNLVYNGTVKKSYDRNGNLISEEQVYPIPLIQMELKAIDERYREKREVDMNVRGGVMIAPADVKSVDEWESKYGGKGPIIEGEVIPPKKGDG